MKRPAFLYAAIVAVLAFAAVVLWLNLSEHDLYPQALDGPPAGPINQSPPPWLPPVDAIAENLMWTRVEDVDGWYRLFWAGTDIYYFDDAAYFGEALAVRSAGNPTGRWTIKGEVQGRPFALAYELREGPPPDGMVEAGSLHVPAGIQWFVRDYTTGRRTFSWVLQK